MAPGKREHSSVKQRENILEKVFQQRVWHSYCNIQTALLLEWNQMALGNDHIVLGQQHIQGPEALVKRMRCLNTQETFPGGELLLWYLTRWQSVSFNPLSFEQWFIVMNRSPPFVCLFVCFPQWSGNSVTAKLRLLTVKFLFLWNSFVLLKNNWWMPGICLPMAENEWDLLLAWIRSAYTLYHPLLYPV